MSRDTNQTPAAKLIRVMIVDDHEVIRQGLQRLLERDKTIIVVGAAKDGLEALRIVKSLRPDVVIMDLRMPHLDGITATRKLKAMLPGIRVLILTSFSDEYFKLAFEAGASGYILKDSAGEYINDAVHQVVNGGCPIAPALTKKLLFEVESLRGAVDDSLLTERETEILRSIAGGVSQSAIAAEKKVSISTVKRDIRSLTDKLGVKDCAQAVSEAFRRNILQ